MANLMNILGNMGYSVSSLGGELLPAVILKEDKIIAGINAEGEIGEIAGADKAEILKIEKAQAFSLEATGIDSEDGNILTQYDDIALTVSLDFQTGDMAYNVVDLQDHSVLASFEEKVAAETEFLNHSGIGKPQNERPARNAELVKDFAKKLETFGYKLTELLEGQVKYDVYNSKDEKVAHILGNNKIAFDTDNKREQNKILNIKNIKNNEVSQRSMLTPFFERLKSLLDEIGFAVYNSILGKERVYGINHNDRLVATVHEDTKELNFTNTATLQEKEIVQTAVDTAFEAPTEEKVVPAQINVNSLSIDEKVDINNAMALIEEKLGVKIFADEFKNAYGLISVFPPAEQREAQATEQEKKAMLEGFGVKAEPTEPNKNSLENRIETAKEQYTKQDKKENFQEEKEL